MRAATFFCTGCILLATPSQSATLQPANTDEAAMLRREAISRSPEQGKGDSTTSTTRIISLARKLLGRVVQTR